MQGVQRRMVLVVIFKFLIFLSLLLLYLTLSMMWRLYMAYANLLTAPGNIF